MDIRSLGYVVIEATDLDKWTSFATEILGMMIAPGMPNNDCLYLKMDAFPFLLMIVPGEHNRFLRSAWELPTKVAFQQALKELQVAGVEWTHGTEDEVSARGVGEFIYFKAPGELQLELFYNINLDYLPLISPVGVKEFVTGYHGDMGLGHIAVQTPTLEDSHHFFSNVMGFGQTDYMHFHFDGDPDDSGHGLHFLHCNNPRHHSLALYESGEAMPGNLVHLMIAVPTVDDLGFMMDRVKAQRDVWAEDDATLISSSYMPVGKVTSVEGGYSLSGHWNFSSGSKHCQWAFLGGLAPPANSGEAPDYRTFLVPRRDYEIVDNWDVSGLEGTGSHDIIVDDKFVPAHRTHRAQDGFACDSPGNVENTAPLYRLPFGQIFVRAVSSSSLGALQAALDEFVSNKRDRVGLNDGKKVSLDPGAQLAAANARATIEECKTTMYRNFDRMFECIESGAELPVDERLKMRFDAVQAAPRCAAAVNDLFVHSGAQGILRSYPVNRAWLDINSGRNHVANNVGKIGRNVGGYMMGLDNEDTFL